MQTFFHGRRRKAGIVALGLAGLVMGLWLRSILVVDAVVFGIGDRQYTFVSDAGSVFCSADAKKPTTPQFSSRLVREGNTYLFRTGRPGPEPYAFGLDTELAVRLHYLPGIWSLMAFSAYLLLWKPRKRA